MLRLSVLPVFIPLHKIPGGTDLKRVKVVAVVYPFLSEIGIKPQFLTCLNHVCEQLPANLQIHSGPDGDLAVVALVVDKYILGRG